MYLKRVCEPFSAIQKSYLPVQRGSEFREYSISPALHSPGRNTYVVTLHFESTPEGLSMSSSNAKDLVGRPRTCLMMNDFQTDYQKGGRFPLKLSHVREGFFRVCIPTDSFFTTIVKISSYFDFVSSGYWVAFWVTQM